MRSDYIIKLIDAFNENDGEKFKKIILDLTEEEKKKGNIQLSNKILAALNKMDSNDLSESQKKSEPMFAASSGLTMFEPSGIYSPKDKSSNNNLIDWHFPGEINMDEIFLSDSISEQLNNIQLEYSSREKLEKLGLKAENRLLLCGPPGCGKTSTAFSLSKKLNIPIAYVRLDSLISSLLGQTGTNIRKIFDSVIGKDVILFLDEFDAIAKKRDDKHELGELKRVVNSLLQNIDTLSDSVFLIAATNHEKLLDSAVWRRFNTTLFLELPDFNLRKCYFDNQVHKYNIRIKADSKKISNFTKGFNFSDLQEVIKKTIKDYSFHQHKEEVTTNDFIKTITNMLTFYNRDSLSSEDLQKFKTNGLTLREISEITGIPKSTISDRLKELQLVE